MAFVPTLPAYNVYAPTTSGGASRGADMGQAQTYHVEVETFIESLDIRTTSLETTTDDNANSIGVLQSDIALLTSQVADLSTLTTGGIKYTSEDIRVRSTANVDISSGLENGDTLNGVTLATGDHVFLGFQSDASENGLYTVVASGAASRATFADSAAELARIGFLILEGTAGSGERWTLALDAADITVDTTDLNFSRTGIEVDYSTAVTAIEETQKPRTSLFPDPLFRWAQTKSVKFHTKYVYSQQVGNGSWDDTLSHEYGTGGWKYTGATGSTMGWLTWFTVPEVEDYDITTGDKVSVGFLTIIPIGKQANFIARFFDGAETTMIGSTASTGAVDGTGEVQLVVLENLSVPAGADGVIAYTLEVGDADYHVIGHWVVRGTTAGLGPPARELDTFAGRIAGKATLTLPISSILTRAAGAVGTVAASNDTTPVQYLVKRSPSAAVWTAASLTDL